MATQQATISKQTFYLTVLIVFLVGFIAGVGFTVYKTGNSTAPSTAAAPTGGPSAEQNQAILNLEAEVTANPTNFNAWTQLGNLYFDTDQVTKSIGAYTKSLELHSGNADLWTDLGVMYRRSGNPAKAVESFDKAIAMDPTHQQSRFNKAIVLHFDLGRTAEALEIWKSLLAINPNYRTANNLPLSDLIAQIEAEQPKKDGK